MKDICASQLRLKIKSRNRSNRKISFKQVHSQKSLLNLDHNILPSFNYQNAQSKRDKDYNKAMFPEVNMNKQINVDKLKDFSKVKTLGSINGVPVPRFDKQHRTLENEADDE